MIDLILLLAAAAATAVGWRRGAMAEVILLLSVIVCAWLSMIYIVPWAVAGLAEDSQRLILAAVIVFLALVFGYVLGATVGELVRTVLRPRSLRQVDSAAGAVVSVATTLTVVWLLAIPLMTAGTTPLGRALQQSRVLGVVDDLAPPWLSELPAEAATWMSDVGFPRISAPAQPREVAAPDTALQRSAVVQNARAGVVKIVGEAAQCRRLLNGSGFVVGPQTVMTNAHVVAGTDRVELAAADERMIPATVTYFNPQLDIALLRADETLDLPILPWAPEPAASGDDAIVLGHPGGGAYTATPARVRDIFRVEGPNIYADGRVEREAYALRAHVVPGNSGGPLLDPTGAVLGVLFGSDSEDPETGYAITKDEVLGQVGDVNGWRVPVQTGACLVKAETPASTLRAE